MNTYWSITLAALLGFVCLPGCADNEPSVEQQQSEASIAPTTSPKQQDSEQVDLAEAAQPVDALPEQDKPASDEPNDKSNNLAQDSSYRPPFPDRTDLFAAPQRQGRRRVSAKGDSLNSIELIGFINVNGLRAVLSINGLEMPVAEGSTRDGIEVISIQEKSVVLQRGRQRWQATLQN